MANSKPVRWLPEAGSQFADPVMVADYAARDPFNPHSIDMLRALALTRRPILDVGCGCAHLTYLLTKVSNKVDAVDPSAAMLAMAQERQPLETKGKINWIHGTVEDDQDSLKGLYGMVTAADSIHWTDWHRFFPKIKSLMLPNAYLVIVERFKGPTAWKVDEKALVSYHYTEKDQGKYDPVDEISLRGYFRLDGTHVTHPILVAKTPEDYIRERHSRNGCSRSRMGTRNTKAFNKEMARIIAPYVSTDGLLHYESYTKLRWGIVL